jgi:CMP-N-acetylneuraminic acid synthetase
LTKNIAIIPARGGSKRLSNKNILTLGEIPLVAHSILYALENSLIIDDVYVSTDDFKIKEIALQFGAKVIARPAELSGDDQPTVTALQHALSTMGDNVDNVFLLQPTSPLRPKNLLKEAYQVYKNADYDSLMTVTRILDKLGKITHQNFVPFNYVFGQRSQDMEPLYSENGLLYITKANFIKKGIILAENNVPFIVDSPFSKIDIDTEEDFKYAQFLLQKKS